MAEHNEANNENAIAAPTALSYEVIKVYPHDTSSYTQGLEWNGNKLIESTGLEGKSVLQILDSNMKPLGNKVKLDKDILNNHAKDLINEIDPTKNDESYTRSEMLHKMSVSSKGMKSRKFNLKSSMHKSLKDIME